MCLLLISFYSEVEVDTYVLHLHQSTNLGTVNSCTSHSSLRHMVHLGIAEVIKANMKAYGKDTLIKVDYTYTIHIYIEINFRMIWVEMMICSTNHCPEKSP